MLKKKFLNLLDINFLASNKQFVNKSMKVTEKIELINNNIINAAIDLASSANSVVELRNILENFDGCSLKQTANKMVFSDGASNAKIMLIGEAPGANEDIEGKPFCGESGKLLDKMMLSINLTRDKNIYISNCVFWRPPANRAPTDEEIEICRPFIEKHIALIKPKLLILVGSTAATTILGKNIKITNIRKEFFLYNNRYTTESINCTAIFHPAYLLRQPSQKKTSWYDLLRIRQFLIDNEIY